MPGDAGVVSLGAKIDRFTLEEILVDLEQDIVHLRIRPNQPCASNRSLTGNGTHKERQIAGRDIVGIVPLERHQGLLTVLGHF